jgi:hypothetical protein
MSLSLSLRKKRNTKRKRKRRRGHKIFLDAVVAGSYRVRVPVIALGRCSYWY